MGAAGEFGRRRVVAAGKLSVGELCLTPTPSLETCGITLLVPPEDVQYGSWIIGYYHKKLTDPRAESEATPSLILVWASIGAMGLLSGI